MTLKELIDQHGFGVWFSNDCRPNYRLLRPLGYSALNNNDVFCDSFLGTILVEKAYRKSLCLYQPKPKTVKKALYAFKHYPDSPREESDGVFYINDEDFEKSYFIANVREPYWFKRLKNTENDFPE